MPRFFQALPEDKHIHPAQVFIDDLVKRRLIQLHARNSSFTGGILIKDLNNAIFKRIHHDTLLAGSIKAAVCSPAAQHLRSLPSTT